MSVKGERSMKVIPGGNQMSLIRDTEEVIKFLEFAGRKLILNEHAIHCRLTACNNLFAVLNEDEDSIDYILGNLDVLINRFRNRNTSVRASTLKVYKSRVKSSLEDFKSWSADPFAWERKVTDKAKAAGLESRKEKILRAKATKAPEPVKKAKKHIAEPVAAVPAEPTVSSDLNRKVAFPIRPDFSIEMTLPAEGLSMKELHRLGLFLYPYCYDLDPERSPWTQIGPQTH